MAAWQQELSGRVSATARLQAARTAMVVGEFGLVDGLLADLDGIDAELVRAETASVRGAPAQAPQRLEALTGTTDQQHAQIALLRSQIHLIGQGRADLAAAALAGVDMTRVEPSLASELRAADALVLLLIGRTADAAALAAGLTADIPVSARITTLVATSIAERLLSDLDTAERQADLGLLLSGRSLTRRCCPSARFNSRTAGSTLSATAVALTPLCSGVNANNGTTCVMAAQ